MRSVRAEIIGAGLTAVVLAAAAFEIVDGAVAGAIFVLQLLGTAAVLSARERYTAVSAPQQPVGLLPHFADEGSMPGGSCADQLSALVCHPVVRTAGLNDAVRVLIEGTAAALQLDRIGLYLVSSDTPQLRIAGALDSRAGSYTCDGLVARSDIAPFDGLFEDGAPGLMEDRTKHPRRDIGRDDPERIGSTLGLGLPVIANGRVAGVLCLARTGPVHGWAQEETMFAIAVCGAIADVIHRIERVGIDAETERSRQALSRQNAVMNELLKRGVVRDGELDEAMRELSRTLSLEAGIDRVAITVLGATSKDVRYAEVYVAAAGAHQQVVTSPTVRPTAMVRAARPEFMIVADDARQSQALAPYYDGLLKLLDIRSFMQMPIEVGGRVVGIVNASICGRTISWSIEQRLFLISIAHIAALVIEREARRKAEARVAAQAEMLTRQLGALTEVMRDDIVIHGKLDEALDRLTRTLGVEIGAERVVLSVCEAVDAHPVYHRAYDAARDEHVTILPDAFAGSTTLDRIEATTAAVEPSHSDNTTLRTPVIVGGRLAGTLTAISPRRNEPWSPDQRLMALALAQLTALTLERVQHAHMERDLRHASQAADAASRAKSRFLASMSHEIRTPMNGVMGMTDHLLRTELDEQQRRMAATIRQCGDTLLTLINDILDLSRIEAGRIEIDPRATDVRTLCDGVVGMFAADVARKGLELTLVVDHSVPEAVSVDDHRLRQVLINLVGNAIKFTETGEIVVRLQTAACGRRLSLSVSDTGIGVAPDRIAALFEPFTQADPTISRRFGGTGLGLAICRRLVGLMGGDIGMSSEPGKGTHVWADLPLVTAQSTPADRPLASRRVALIAGPGAGRERTKIELERAGATVTIVEGDVAATAAPLAAVDAVVVHLERHQSSPDVLRAVRKAHPNAASIVALLPPGAATATASTHHVTMIARPHAAGDLITALMAGSTAPSTSRERPQPTLSRFAKRVLLIEDNSVNELVLSEHMIALGCAVQIVRDGAAAVAAFEKGRFDLVLMDAQLPGMGGLAATRAIRTIEARRRRKRVPIVVVTASAFPEDIEAAKAAGCDDYLAKPFSEAGLIDTMERVLGGAASRPASAAKPPVQAKPPKRSAPRRSTKAPDAKPVARPRPARAAGIDEAALRRLEAANARLFARLLTTYIEYTPRVIAALGTAARAGDAAGLRLAAHSLKSSSGNVCAATLTELARSAEAAAKKGLLDDAEALAAEIEAEFAAVTLRLRTELDRVSRTAA